MKRILHIVSCLERGGTEAFIMNHYRVLDREKYQFDFLVLHKKDYPYLEEIRRLGGRIFFVTVPSIRNIGRFLREAVSVMRETGPYCAVHSHINIENAWVMVAAAKADIPVRVSHSHDTIGKEGSYAVRQYRTIQERLIKRYATDFLACSTDSGNYLYGEVFFQSGGKVIRNGIDVEKFLFVTEEETNQLKSVFGITPENGPIIGNISRFEPKKNQIFAVDVFRQVLKKCPNAILVLGGPDGGDLAKIKDKVRQEGLQDHVRFIGTRSDVPVCLKLLDVYLFPSLYEGLGIVMLEAQAAGCFCVASTGVSRESDMGLGHAVYLNLSDSAESWAEYICNKKVQNLKNHEVVEAFEKKGYSIHQSVQELVKIYDQG